MHWHGLLAGIVVAVRGQAEDSGSFTVAQVLLPPPSYLPTGGSARMRRLPLAP